MEAADPFIIAASSAVASLSTAMQVLLELVVSCLWVQAMQQMGMGITGVISHESTGSTSFFTQQSIGVGGGSELFRSYQMRETRRQGKYYPSYNAYVVQSQHFRFDINNSLIKIR
jgi:hypothetical protein